MDAVSILAEQKIRQAIDNGELDNLRGKGKPLNLEDLSRLPEDLRSGYIIMKNAGMIPEEMQLKKELVTLQNLIDCCHHPEEKKALRKKLTEKQLRFDMLMEKRKTSNSAAFDMYKHKIYDRFNGK
ncbi:MAG: DUF1992 domain-containing protein [Bacillaceae bacterium]|nr:DUF1992 domain-containing protein [Bacillaceae bacterium]